MAQIKKIIIIAIILKVCSANEFVLDWNNPSNRPGLTDEIYEIPSQHTTEDTDSTPSSLQSTTQIPETSSVQPEDDTLNENGTENEEQTGNEEGGLKVIKTLESEYNGEDDPQETPVVPKTGNPEEVQPEDEESDDSDEILAVIEPQEEKKEVEITDKDIYRFQENLGIFASDIYYDLIKKSKRTENIIFSPLSISHAVGMLNAGAKGRTSTQIKKILRYTVDTPKKYINSLFRENMAGKFSKEVDSGVVKLMSARSFVHQTLVIREQYEETLQNDFHSNIEPVDFRYPKNATERMNQWVEYATNDLIKNLIPEGVVTPMTKLVLVNTLYFKAPWSAGFKEVPLRGFKAPGGDVSVTFLKTTATCAVQFSDDTTALAIPYKDEDTFFFIFMPHSQKAMKAYEEDEENFFHTIKDISSWEERKINLFIPKFTIEQEVDVKAVLKSLGVTDVFKSTADLSGMTEIPLYVSHFLHKAKISVHKGGTEAAAASAAVSVARTLLSEVIINRPFKFGVVEKGGDILFMGKLVEPSGK